MRTLALQPIPAAQIEHAHETYEDVFDWLSKRGVRQWLLKLDQAAFRARHAKGELFGIYAGQWLIGSVMIARETLPYYGEPFASTPRWWMHTLNINRKCSGAQIGAQIVEFVCAHVRRERGEDLWLHCVNDPNFDDTMPGYYRAKKFREVMRTEVTYPSGNAFEMVLMVRAI